MNNFIQKLFTVLLKKVKDAGSIETLLNKTISRAETIKKEGITIHNRPLYPNQVGEYPDVKPGKSKVAIVLQGPLITDLDFTLNSIRIYKKLFSGSVIILSTWKDENPETLEKISKENIEILLNEKPAFAGQQNINYQIHSALQGILKAEEKGCNYVFKTRTDQRMYAPGIAEYFLKLLEKFPVTHQFPQKQRLIAISLNTFKYRLYGISDMFMFGNIADIKNYWDCKFDNRTFENIPLDNVLEFAKCRICEVYLFTEYLQKLGKELAWTLDDSLQSVRDFFIIVNQNETDLYWPKYSRLENRWLSYKGITTSQEINFKEWFLLYTDFENQIDKNINLNIPFDSVVTLTGN